MDRSIKNITCIIGISLIFSGFLFSREKTDPEGKISWPEGKKAAIVLTYDDALWSHIYIAVPRLNEKGLKGTFFLNGYTIPEEDIPMWRKFAETGHELGNHSLYHPCSSRKKNDEPCFTLESYSVNSMLREISIMNSFLYAIDGDTVRTYAYPCGEILAGGEDFSFPLSQSKRICGARIGGSKNSIIDRYDRIDLFKIPSFVPAKGETGESMTDYVKDVVKAGGFGVFTFHGIGGDYIDITAEAHDELVNYLSDHSDDIWVVSFRELIHYLSTRIKK